MRRRRDRCCTSGDWVVPHLLDKVRTAKPVFIYWCQASAMRIFGANEFAARFPSAIAMTLTLLVLAIMISRMIGERRAMWTIFVLATSALAIAAAKMCLTDAVLLLFVTTAQVCLGIIYARGASATLPLPPGEGWGEGVFAGENARPMSNTPSPQPSPEGRGGQTRAPQY